MRSMRQIYPALNLDQLTNERNSVAESRPSFCLAATGALSHLYRGKMLASSEDLFAQPGGTQQPAVAVSEWVWNREPCWMTAGWPESYPISGKLLIPLVQKVLGD